MVHVLNLFKLKNLHRLGLPVLERWSKQLKTYTECLENLSEDWNKKWWQTYEGRRYVRE